MDTQLLSELCQKQAENERLREAITDFREKRQAVENSQGDAFSHQGKRVQRRQHELQEARKKLYSFLEDEETSS
jgi:hypothetical protein